MTRDSKPPLLAVTQSAFAEMKGVSRKSVSEWKRKGQIVMLGDLVDVEATQAKLPDGAGSRAKGRRAAVTLTPEGDTAAVTLPAEGDTSGVTLSAEGNRFAVTLPARVTPRTPAPGAGRPVPEAMKLGPDSDPEVIVAQADAFAADVLAGRYLPLGEAEKIKENALALKHMLDARKRAGNLVEMDAVVDAAFRRARSDRDAWLNWPSRIAPLLAADLGLETGRVAELLSAHVHQQLADLGEPELDFEGSAAE